MRINLTPPFNRSRIVGELFDVGGMRDMAQLAERAGFASSVVTDRPCPTVRWLDMGGHHAQDPFVLLSCVAAATQTLCVLPYRNPLLTARAVATLDFLSGGRIRLGVGSDYPKGEYRAPGVDFDTRDDLTDEYIRALKTAWASEELSLAGSGYEAFGTRIVPQPHRAATDPAASPILIGGNSRRATRRAAEPGDAWSPFPTASTALAAIRQTAEPSTEAGLAETVASLRETSAAAGRAAPREIELTARPGPAPGQRPGNGGADQTAERTRRHRRRRGPAGRHTSRLVRSGSNGSAPRSSPGWRDAARTHDDMNACGHHWRGSW